ncbi:MAG TPA: class I SAM-dependent methyltransferase [Isosphaeraceae bacterium]|nr:class I SAM-dependent methyltransferase [Isosphaeraceae bacterium]
MLRHLTDPITFRRLTHLGVGPGWRCLDVGAGDGTVARWLAGRVGLGGRVVATDINPRLLDGNGCPSLEIRRHDILEEGHYNLVHCRTLLMHLACSLRALVSTRPDG